MTAIVDLAAGVFTNIDAAAAAEGIGEYHIWGDMADLEVGLVTNAQTPSALPDIDVSKRAARVLKPHESTLKIWAHSVTGGRIYIKAMNAPLIVDTTGVTSV